MHTVVLRLAATTFDGRLHGVIEVVGDAEVVPFAGDRALLDLLHEVQARAAPGDHRTGAVDGHLNPT